jgi:membrane protease YdiL (CAAX protease family)
MKYLENILGKDNAFWKYIVVAIVTFIAMQIIGGIFAGIVIVIHVLRQGGDFTQEMAANIKSLSDIGISENTVLLMMLVPFAAGLLTAWLLIKGMHRQTFAETVNGRDAIRWNRVIAGFGVWFALMAVFLAGSYIVNPDNFRVQFDAEKFVPLLIISLLFIPLQTTCEEYIFRGYIAQGIGAWTRNRWLVIIIPALLFGLMHYSNNEVKEHGFWVAMPPYIIFGLFFGLVAVLDDGIELPIGMHAANNLFACLFVTNGASSLRTPAVFYQEEIFHLSDTVGLIVAAALAMMWFYRKYQWNFDILNRRIEANHDETTYYQQ